MMLSPMIDRVEELRQAGLAAVRENRLEDAVSLYDEALGLASDDETCELLTINKADALIALERTGPEVQELPRVIMRRRNPRHVCLAAYALQYKHRLENDLKRAMFYGELALRAATETADPLFRRAALEAVTGFDPKFFMYFEDADISFRIARLGYRVRYYPEAHVFHHWSRASHQSWRMTLVSIRSSFYLFSKHGWKFL